MADTGFIITGTGGNDATVGATDWTTPGNITASDSVPAIVSRHTVSANVQNSIKLIKGGTISGDEKSTGALITFGPPYVNNDWGSSSDLWGLTLSDTDVNASNFGVGISVSGNLGISHYLTATNFGFSIPSGATINGIVARAEWNQHTATVFVDSVSIIVYYTAAPTTPVSPFVSSLH